MNISLESIHQMTASERAQAVAILQKSMLAKLDSGKEMIALLNFLDEDSDGSQTGTVGGMEVTVGPGADGKFGTADDTVVVQPPPLPPPFPPPSKKFRG